MQQHLGMGIRVPPEKQPMNNPSLLSEILHYGEKPVQPKGT